MVNVLPSEIPSKNCLSMSNWTFELSMTSFVPSWRPVLDCHLDQPPYGFRKQGHPFPSSVDILREHTDVAGGQTVCLITVGASLR